MTAPGLEEQQREGCHAARMGRARGSSHGTSAIVHLGRPRRHARWQILDHARAPTQAARVANLSAFSNSPYTGLARGLESRAAKPAPAPSTPLPSRTERLPAVLLRTPELDARQIESLRVEVPVRPPHRVLDRIVPRSGRLHFGAESPREGLPLYGRARGEAEAGDPIRHGLQVNAPP